MFVTAERGAKSSAGERSWSGRRQEAFLDAAMPREGVFDTLKAVAKLVLTELKRGG